MFIKCKDISKWQIVDNPEYRDMTGAQPNQVINELGQIVYEGSFEACKTYCGGIALNESHKQAKDFADNY